jgi:hypothetical protein
MRILLPKYEAIERERAAMIISIAGEAIRQLRENTRTVIASVAVVPRILRPLVNYCQEIWSDDLRGFVTFVRPMSRGSGKTRA